MATYNTSRLYDKKVICPYDSAHILTVVTISKHLIKCAKRHPDIILERCPFNATHRVQAGDLPQHMLECADREVVDAQLVYRERIDQIRGNLAVPNYDIQTTVHTRDEDWDDENESLPARNFDHYDKGESKFMDVNGHISCSKKERLKMYKRLLPGAEEETSADEQKSAEKTSAESVTKPRVTRVTNNASKEIRRPMKEGVAGMIHKEFTGLGRGLRRCAATFTGVGGDPSAMTYSEPFKQNMRPANYQPKTATIGRGRGLLPKAGDLTRDGDLKKTVNVPPGFENRFFFLNQVDDAPIQVPLEEGQVEVTPQNPVDKEMMSEFKDLEKYYLHLFLSLE